MRSESFSDHYTDEELSDFIASGNNSGRHSSSEERVTGSSSETKAAAQKLAEKEGTKSILLSKGLLVTTIILSAAGVALLTYFYTSSLETSKFKTQVRTSIGSFFLRRNHLLCDCFLTLISCISSSFALR